MVKENGGKWGRGSRRRWVPGKTAILNRVVMEDLAEKVTSEQRKRMYGIKSWFEFLDKSPRKRKCKVSEHQMRLFQETSFHLSTNVDWCPGGSGSLTHTGNTSVDRTNPLASRGLCSQGKLTFFQTNSFYSTHHLFENEVKLYTMLLNFPIYERRIVC